jgi:adenylate cyclase
MAEDEQPPAGPDTPNLPDKADQEQAQRGLLKALKALRETDAKPGLVRAARATRELLPGDSQFGDDLSTDLDRPSHLLARHLAEQGEKRPSAARELGLTALQVWQAISGARESGETDEVTILFTDLVEFSSWALEAGDDRALELLRQVAGVVEPAIRSQGGRIVKRLGDGHMAVFSDPEDAVGAALDIQEDLGAIEVAGYRPSLRAGVHLGRPQRMGGDYLGVDVNAAARVAEAARGGEVLVSGPVLERLETDGLEVKRRKRFRAKGAPTELSVFTVARQG